MRTDEPDITETNVFQTRLFLYRNPEHALVAAHPIPPSTEQNRDAFKRAVWRVTG
jgi:hypothetical protein